MFTKNCDIQSVNASDSVRISGNVSHSIVILEAMKVIGAFTPARGDFL